jgi:hypothetical protein
MGRLLEELDSKGTWRIFSPHPSSVKHFARESLLL